jgi:hypothetical protein
MEKSKKTTSINILKPIKKFLKRFHLTLFLILIVAGLSSAVLVINNTLEDTSTDPSYTSLINAGSIDQTTLTRLNDLHTSTEGNPAQTLPPGRINPVNE